MTEPRVHRTLLSDSLNNLNVVVRYLGHLNPLTVHRKSKKVKAFFALALVCFFWGTTWLASKQGVRHMPSALQLAGLRQLFGGLCYVIFFLARKTAMPKGKEWWPIIVLSFLNFMLSNALSTWGVQYISAGLGSIIGAIFPLWLVIIGFFGGSRMKTSSVAGLVLGFTGICVIFYEYLGDFVNPAFRFGVLLSLASTWSWAFGTIYTKRHAVHFNPYFGLGWQMVISGITLLLGTSIAGEAIPLASIPWEAWASIAYLVVFGSVISFVAYLYALQNLPTEQVSIYAYLNPVVAVILGWLLLGEKLTAFIIIGVLITLLGVYLVNRSVVQKVK